MSIYSDLLTAVNEVAEELTNEGKPQFTAKDVSQWLKTNRAADWARFEPSFQANLSALSRDPDCNIERVPGRFSFIKLLTKSLKVVW